jgi:hypothetical protein
MCLCPRFLWFVGLRYGELVSVCSLAIAINNLDTLPASLLLVLASLDWDLRVSNLEESGKIPLENPMNSAIYVFPLMRRATTICHNSGLFPMTGVAGLWHV